MFKPSRWIEHILGFFQYLQLQLRLLMHDIRIKCKFRYEQFSLTRAMPVILTDFSRYNIIEKRNRIFSRKCLIRPFRPSSPLRSPHKVTQHLLLHCAMIGVYRHSGNIPWNWYLPHTAGFCSWMWPKIFSVVNIRSFQADVNVQRVGCRVLRPASAGNLLTCSIHLCEYLKV
jgi:hypothetical protein